MQEPQTTLLPFLAAVYSVGAYAERTLGRHRSAPAR